MHRVATACPAHAFIFAERHRVDGRDKRGHDAASPPRGA